MRFCVSVVLLLKCLLSWVQAASLVIADSPSSGIKPKIGTLINSLVLSDTVLEVPSLVELYLSVVDVVVFPNLTFLIPIAALSSGVKSLICSIGI
mgnify:FL=1